MIHQYMGVVIAIDPFQLVYRYICINRVYWSSEPLILSFALQEKPGIFVEKTTRDSWNFSRFLCALRRGPNGDSKSLNRQRAPRHVVVALRATPQEEAGPAAAAFSAAATLRATTAESTAELTAKQMPPWSAGVLPASWIIKKPLLKMKIIQKRTSFKES